MTKLNHNKKLYKEAYEALLDHATDQHLSQERTRKILTQIDGKQWVLKEYGWEQKIK